VIADLSVNHVERSVLRCGWTVQRTTHDYGVDLLMETYTAAGEPENGRVLFQLKATDNLKVRAKQQAVAVRLEWRDVQAWRTELMPVIPVLYDAQEDRAYWLHVQPYFTGPRRRPRRRIQETTTVYLPCHQVVNEAAVRQFAELRDAALSRIRGCFSMTTRVTFAELRQLLLDMGFREVSRPEAIAFRHQPSDTLFVFRPYRASDPVASYNLLEVKDMLDARGLMSAETFENQFKKTPA
jgi:hypothetical protein